MADSRKRSSPKGIALELRPRDQTTVAAIVLLGVFALLGAPLASPWWSRVVDDERPDVQRIDLDSAPRRSTTWQVDVNSATWAEIAELPGVGDQLARDLVADRQRRGPFRSAADLRRVRGVGPKTWQRVRPWLAPLSDGK